MRKKKEIKAEETPIEKSIDPIIPEGQSQTDGEPIIGEQPTKEEIMNAIKYHLQQGHALAKQFGPVIGNGQIHIHIGSIANKWFGGINTQGVTITAPPQQTSQRVYKPTADDFKKKPDLEARRRAKPVTDDLDKTSLSVLKVMAKELKLDFKGRDKPGLIEMIRMAKKRTPRLIAEKNKSEEEE